MKRSRLIVVIAAVALVGFALAGAGAANLLKGRPTSVAVVDVEKVFNALQEKLSIEANLRGRQEKLVGEKNEKEKDLKSLKGELDILNPGTDGFKKKQEELEKKVFEFQAWQQWQNNALVRDNRLQITLLYNKITGSLGKIAQDEGIDVILFKEGDADFGNVDPKELSGAIRSRKVLWTAADLDLTDRVIQSMNNDYKNNVK